MVKKIEYENKVAIQNDDSIAEKNKVTDANMNEIKETVNNNADELVQAQEDIVEIKQEQTTQNANIQKLQADNTTNKEDIKNIKAKNTEQDTSIQNNTENIESLQAENEELKAENERLRADNNALAIIGQASGENITLNDSSNARFTKFEIGGNHSQKTREGYNKFNYEDFVENVSSTAVSGEAKSFKLSTNSGTYDFKDLKENTSYCVSGRVMSNIVNGSLSLVYSDGSSTTIFEQYDNASIDKTFKINSNASKTLTTLKITIYGNTYITINDFMVYEGTEDKPYEPYGASPSLEFPSPVKTVGQNVNELSDTEDDWEQGGFNNDGEPVMINATILRMKNFMKIFNNKYYISILNDQYTCANIFMYDESEKYVGNYYNKITDKIFGATSMALSFPDGCKKIKIVLKNKDSNKVILPSEISLIKAKFEQGLKATPYSPYGMGSAEINVCNKNFANIDKVVQSSVIKLEGNTIHVKNSTGQALFYTTIFKNLDLPFDEYTISVNNLSGTYKSGNIIIKNTEGKDISEAGIETYKKRF